MISLVEALTKIAAIEYPYCRGCRARTANHVERYTLNKVIAAQIDDCSCKACNEDCESDCPRGIAREALAIDKMRAAAG
jgi:hypothetical protein